MESPRPSQLRTFWRQWLQPVAMTAVVLFSVRSSLADWYVVPTGSMKPTIVEGDRIWTNKMAYDLRMPFVGWRLVHRADPRPAEIVVFTAPNGTRMVKRVIGIPGDTVELRRNRVLVNGRALAYGPADADILAGLDPPAGRQHHLAMETLGGRWHALMVTPGIAAPRDYGPVVVPPDHYFVMGDNRDGSVDSRSFGFVPRADIIGRTSRVVLSLDAARYFRPRFERTLRELP